MANILIIDDDDRLRQLLSIVLEQGGHSPAQARNGLEGERMFRAGDYDLVLCDILMPDREGLETMRSLKRVRRDVPIIVMSGGMIGGPMDPLNVATLLGATRTLSKPFRMETLLLMVSELLTAQRADSLTGDPARARGGPAPREVEAF